MTRQKSFGTLVLAFGVVSLAGLPVFAQDRTSNGNTTGASAPRGGDGGGGAVSRGDGGSSSSSGSSGSGATSGFSGGSAMGSSPTPSAWSASPYEAPTRSSDAPHRANASDSGGGQRTRSGASTGSSTSRSGNDGGSSSRGSSASSGSNSSGGNRSAASSGDDSAPSRRAVPEFSARGSLPPGSGGGGTIIVNPYTYYPWGYFGGYGFGLGYMFYDPFGYGGYGYGWGDPYGYGGYGGYGYGGYGYGGGSYGGSGGYGVSQSYRETGNLRLKIDPKHAKVYIDGAFVGEVDSFDGSFQKLPLEAGSHKVELKADGYEPTEFEVTIIPGETATFKGDMKRIK
jgi:hypothetical protein